MADRGEAEYRALMLATDDCTPSCTGDPRFILDGDQLAPQELAHLKHKICHPCPLRALCEAYAEAARPPAGVWAGRTYKPGRKATAA